MEEGRLKELKLEEEKTGGIEAGRRGIWKREAGKREAGVGKLEE